MNTLGRRMVALREERDLKRADVAQALGIGYSTFQGYETEGKEPRFDTLCRIADYFDVSTDYLLGRTDDRRSEPQSKGGTTRMAVNMDKLKELDEHWKEVMDLAEKYGFILQAYGGTATLATHQNQLEAFRETNYIDRQWNMFRNDMKAQEEPDGEASGGK